MPDFFDDSGAPSAPAPSAPAPSGGVTNPYAGVQIPTMKFKGMTLQFPNVNQPASLKLDQDLAKASEDLGARLGDLNVAVTSQQKRDKQTTPMDKAIGMAIGVYYGRDPFGDPQVAEKGSIWRQHRQYAANQGAQGGVGGGGFTTPRDAVFTNAGSTRQAIYQWILAQSKSRNYKVLGDVSSHIPYETDTDELLAEKMAFWRQRLAETNAELKQRGINVQQMPLPPSAGIGAETPSEAPPSSTPPFRVKSSSMAGGTRIYQDDSGNWWYVDRGNWVKFGG